MMEPSPSPASAVERAMKVQEVILRAIDGRLKWYQAAEILGISDRQMRRWKRRYERGGYDGLFDRRRQQPSPKRVPLEVVRQVLTLYRERYFDCNVLHFHEKLQGEHGIGLSYTWVKTALQTAGLVATAPRRGTHRKARPRRPGRLLRALHRPGESLHHDPDGAEPPPAPAGYRPHADPADPGAARDRTDPGPLAAGPRPDGTAVGDVAGPAPARAAPRGEPDGRGGQCLPDPHHASVPQPGTGSDPRPP